MTAKPRGARNWKHGYANTRTYRIWQGMKSRCSTTVGTNWPNYAGRGIRVCDRWLESFDNFLADMGDAPAGYSIERKDNDGNYEPTNCVWATKREQNNNSRNCRLVTFRGRTQSAKAWADELGLDAQRVRVRLGYGWTPEEALTMSVDDAMMNRAIRAGGKGLVTFRGETRNMLEWSRVTGIKHSTIQYRLKAGWTVEDALTLPNQVRHQSIAK